MRTLLGAPDIDWFKQRLNLILYMVLGTFVVLFMRLFFLQVMEGEDLRRLSENNSIRLQSLDAPRGLIFDRKGTLLVENRPSFDLTLIPKDAKPLDETLSKLALYADIPKAELTAAISAAGSVTAYRPVLLKRDIGRNTLAAIETHKFDLPGVAIDVKMQRNYLYPAHAAHLIGYLGEINAAELKKAKYLGYRPGDLIGKYGVEKIVEQFLRGKRGGRQVEVNVTGQVVRILKTVPAVQGNNIYLSIDHELQQKAENLLDGRAGAIVAMDPRNGHLLALVSGPAYDQNAFVNKLSYAQWNALVSDPARPMQNKAVQGEYPPASVYKIITAIAGLEEGVVDEDDTFFCPGWYKMGDRVFRCWKKNGHGTVNIVAALAESCDVYFYKLGEKLGVDRIATYAKASGLGAPTGTALEHEAAGLVPTKAWKKARMGTVWYKGETLSVAIGQGYNLVTPLQMAVLISAVANGGTRYTPLILKKIEAIEAGSLYESDDEIKGRLPVDPYNLSIIQKGLWQVVNQPKGTAWGSRIMGVEMSGKTGTAQLFGRKNDATGPVTPINPRLLPHAWFLGYAPTDDPRIAVSVIVENGISGSKAAAPIAGKLIEFYLQKEGL